jgi:hypothetical protein
MDESAPLKTANEVMDALGGNEGVMELTGRKQTAVLNWRASGKFPAKFHLLMTQALAHRGLRAPASLWGVPEFEPERAAS